LPNFRIPLCVVSAKNIKKGFIMGPTLYKTERVHLLLGRTAVEKPQKNR